jgi:hypothetical protein
LKYESGIGKIIEDELLKLKEIGPASLNPDRSSWKCTVRSGFPYAKINFAKSLCRLYISQCAAAVPDEACKTVSNAKKLSATPEIKPEDKLA